MSKTITPEEMEHTQDAAEMRVGDYHPHPDDPRANQEGAYVQGVEQIVVPIRTETKAAAVLEVVKRRDGQWTGGYQCSREDDVSAGVHCMIDGDGYATRKEAVQAAIEDVERKLGCLDERIDLDIANFGSEVGQWPGEDAIVDLPQGPLPEPEPAPQPVESLTPEERHVRAIQEAEAECSEAYLELMRLKDAAKGQTEYLKACGERLSRLKLRGPEELPLFDKPAAQQSAEQNGTLTTPADDTAPAWWNHDTSRLFDEPLPGFGPKLIAAICQAAPTIGELEELRADAGLDSIKGVSKAKAEELTERILEYCGTYNRDVTADGEADQREDWEKARDECEAVIKLCGDVPEAGEQFAADVHDQAADMADWIENNERVTPDQWEAIRNWRSGLEAWNRD